MDAVIDILMAAVKAGILTGGGKDGEYAFTVADASDPIHITIRSSGRATVATSTGADETHFDLNDEGVGATALLLSLFDAMVEENLDQKAMSLHNMIVEAGEAAASEADDSTDDGEDEESDEEEEESDEETDDTDADAEDSDSLLNEDEEEEGDSGDDAEAEDTGETEENDEDEEGDEEATDEEASAPSYTDPEAFLDAIETAAKPNPVAAAIKARMGLLTSLGFTRPIQGINGVNTALLNNMSVSLLFDRVRDNLPLAPRSVVISNNDIKQATQGGWGDVHRGIAVIKDFYQRNMSSQPAGQRVLSAISKLESVAADDSAPMPKTNAGSVGPTIDSSKYQAALLDLAQALGNTQPAGEPTRLLVDMTIKTSLSVRLYTEKLFDPPIIMDVIWSSPDGPRLLVRKAPANTVDEFVEALGKVQRAFHDRKAISVPVSSTYPNMQTKLAAVIERVRKNADIRNTTENLLALETASYDGSSSNYPAEAVVGGTSIGETCDPVPTPSAPDPLFADSPNAVSTTNPLNVTELLSITGDNRTYQVRRAIASQIGHYPAYEMFDSLLRIAALTGYFSMFMCEQAEEWTNKMMVYARSVYGEVVVKEIQGIINS